MESVAKSSVARTSHRVVSRHDANNGVAGRTPDLEYQKKDRLRVRKNGRGKNLV